MKIKRTLLPNMQGPFAALKSNPPEKFIYNKSDDTIRIIATPFHLILDREELDIICELAKSPSTAIISVQPSPAPKA